MSHHLQYAGKYLQCGKRRRLSHLSIVLWSRAMMRVRFNEHLQWRFRLLADLLALCDSEILFNSTLHARKRAVSAVSKDRGVKPLRIALAQAEAELGHVDSQEQDFEADKDSQCPIHHDSLVGFSPPLNQVDNRRHPTSSPLGVSHSPDQLADPEDFP
jgi:hypothetical protein